MTRRRHRVWWAGAGLVLALAALVAYWAIAPRRALERYRAALKAQGVRLNIGDCMPPLVPDHHQAALRFLAAAQGLPSHTRGEWLSPFPAPVMLTVAPGRATAGWSQPAITDGRHTRTWSELSELMQEAGPRLREIHESTQADAFRWNLNWSEGMMMLLPHLGHTKSAAQWLEAESMLALREGRIDDAIQAQLTQLRLVHNLREEPLLIGQLVRIAVAAITWSGTWALLQVPDWTDGQLARLQAGWDGVEFIEAMRLGLETERALGLYEYGRLRRSPALLGHYLDLGALGGFGGGLAGADDGDVSLLGQVIEAVGTAFGKLRQGSRGILWATFESYADEQFYIESLEQLMREAQSRVASVSAAAGRPVVLAAGASFIPNLGYDETVAEGYLLASATLRSLDLAFEKAFLMQTQRELARAAIALRRYKLAHGRLPESLDELVPRFLEIVPCDWMDGAPLRYRRVEGGGFTLYSVGRDGRDDGGDPTPANPQVMSLAPYVGKDFLWPAVATEEEVEAFRARPSRGRQPGSGRGDPALQHERKDEQEQ